MGLRGEVGDGGGGGGRGDGRIIIAVRSFFGAKALLAISLLP